MTDASKPHQEPEADMTYFGDGHAFTVSGDPEQLDKMAAYISVLKHERTRLLEELETTQRILVEERRWRSELSDAVERMHKTGHAHDWQALMGLVGSNPATATAYGPEQPGWADYAGPPVSSPASRPS